MRTFPGSEYGADAAGANGANGSTMAAASVPAAPGLIRTGSLPKLR